jgi:FixJ family two-component response regulator
MSGTQNIHVAIVDDDESLCRSLSRLLRAAHLQPTTYPSAEAFLADTKHPKFDCLVLDIQLGGMSGLELRERLSAVEDHTPVIFCTALEDPGVRFQAEALGCVDYFRKTDLDADILQLSVALSRWKTLIPLSNPEKKLAKSTQTKSANSDRDRLNRLAWPVVSEPGGRAFGRAD